MQGEGAESCALRHNGLERHGDLVSGFLLALHVALGRGDDKSPLNQSVSRMQYQSLQSYIYKFLASSLLLLYPPLILILLIQEKSAACGYCCTPASAW
jgi:hypothetical protein